MKLSIIIPAYNAAETIEASVESVLAQTFQDYEIIIVNDASTDATPEIMENYARKDSRIKAVHIEHGGLSVARNSGLELACGEYIAFLDSDDILGVEDMYSLYVSYLDAHTEINILQFPTLWQNENPEIKGKIDKVFTGKDDMVMGLFKKEIAPTAWDKIYRREVFDIARFDPGRCYEDTWFLMDIMPHIDNIATCSYGYYTYVFRQGSIVNSKLTVSKWRNRIERNLRYMGIFPESEKDKSLYIDYYTILLHHLFQSSKELGINNFKDFNKKIKDVSPSIVAIMKSHVGMLQKIKLMVCNLIGPGLITRMYRLSK